MDEIHEHISVGCIDEERPAWIAVYILSGELPGELALPHAGSPSKHKDMLVFRLAEYRSHLLELCLASNNLQASRRRNVAPKAL